MARKNYPLEKSSVCRNCGSENIENYCSHCGQTVQTQRFTLGAFFDIFFDAFSLEKGFIHTFVYLFTKPGTVIKDSISGRTKPYANPLKYLIIIAGVYAFIFVTTNIYEKTLTTTYDFMFNSTETMQQVKAAADENPGQAEFQTKLFEVMGKYLNLIPLILIPFMSKASKWLYKSRKYLYGEHLIINCYVIAQSFAIITVVMLLILLIPAWIKYFPIISGIIFLSYMSYAYHKIFSKHLFVNIIKTISTYIIGYIYFLLFFVAVGLVAMIVIVMIKLTASGAF